MYPLCVLEPNWDNLDERFTIVILFTYYLKEQFRTNAKSHISKVFPTSLLGFICTPKHNAFSSKHNLFQPAVAIYKGLKLELALSLPT